jgi:hypothetical protein
VDIMKQTGRSWSTIDRVVRGLSSKRKRPTSPPGRNTERNDQIIALIESAASHA